MRLRLVASWSAPSGPELTAGLQPVIYERLVERPYPCVPAVGDSIDVADGQQPLTIAERAFADDGAVSLYFGLGPEWADSLVEWGFELR